MSHTPTPWKIASDTGPCVISNGEREIGECYEDGETQVAEDEANAAHIVKCVNAHGELVAALERIRGLIAEDAGIAPLIAKEALLKVPA
jgi:phosphohistidine swiveling domain-containing protein